MPASTHAAASTELARRDPVVAELVRRHGPMRLGRRTPVGGRFEALARSIAYQQLAGAAASTIWGRVRALVDGPLDPAAVAALPVEALRGAGLSGAKAASLHDLAAASLDGRIHLDRVGRMGDDEVVAMLTTARGIGPWTAQMFLLFTLQRLDVWPTGDLGVRAGYARAWGLAELPPPRRLEELGEAFRPYRSVAAWFCWRATEGPATPVTAGGPA